MRPIVLLLLLVCVASAWFATAAAAQPNFEPSRCNLPGAPPSILALLRCGSVAVPRDRSAPGAGMLRLAVVIIASASPSRRGDPVVVVAGGPDPASTTRASAIAAREAAFIAPDRDLILVDPRGSGRSEPVLCPDLAQQHLAALASGADEPALLAAWRNSYATCRLEMADDGVRPEWFGTQASAEDLEAVRQALGLGRWNLYARSHGADTALTLMARHPESLRAVVLDGVPSPDPAPGSRRALDRYIASCGDDAICARIHPAFGAQVAAALQTLDAAPLTVVMPPGLGITAFTLRAATFRIVADRLLATRAGEAVLPSFVAGVLARNGAALQPVLAGVAKGYGAMSLGAMAAIGCRERLDWRDARPGVNPQVGAYVPGLCTNWSPPGPPPEIPDDTTVPSLVVSGSADPWAAPDAAQAVVKALGASARVVDLADDPRIAGRAPCGLTIVAAFMADPSRAPDTACAAGTTPAAPR